VRFVHARLRGLAISKLLTSVSLQLTNIFLALLMINNGLGFEHVCWVYLLQTATRLASLWPIIWMLGRGNVGGGFFVGYCARAVQAISLTFYIANAEVWSLVAVAISFGVGTSFVNTSEAYYIAQRLENARKGKDVSRLEIAAQAVGWFSPLAGAWLAAVRGQVWLGVFAAALAVAAVIPVWSKENFARFKRVVPQERTPLPWRDMWASAAWITQGNAGMWLWYAYLAVIMPSFQMIGSIATVSAVSAFLAIELAGHLTDRYRWGARTVLVAVVVMTSVLGVFRSGIVFQAVVETLPVIAVLFLLSWATATNDTFSILIQTAWRVRVYSRVAKYGLSYLAAIEGAVAFASVVFWALMAVLMRVGGELVPVMTVVLLFGAICVLFTPLIDMESNQEITVSKAVGN